MYDEPLKFAKVGRFDIPLNDKSEPSRLHQWFAFQSAPDFLHLPLRKQRRQDTVRLSRVSTMNYAWPRSQAPSPLHSIAQANSTRLSRAWPQLPTRHANYPQSLCRRPTLHSSPASAQEAKPPDGADGSKPPDDFFKSGRAQAPQLQAADQVL